MSAPGARVQIVTDLPGVGTFYVYRGRDGAVVVELETPDLGENAQGPTPLRMYLNDHCVYENPAFPLEVAS